MKCASEVTATRASAATSSGLSYERSIVSRARSIRRLAASTRTASDGGAAIEELQVHPDRAGRDQPDVDGGDLEPVRRADPVVGLVALQPLLAGAPAPPRLHPAQEQDQQQDRVRDED